MRKSDDTDEQSAEDASQAEFFSKFFIEKFNQIRKDTAGGSETDFTANSAASFCTFQLTTPKSWRI